MMLMSNYIMIIIIINLILMALTFILTKKKMKNIMKMSPFECGLSPFNNNHIPFSIHFFLISIIFLIFDVEITLIIPMIFNFSKSNLLIWYSTCFYFFILLLFSLFYEWKNSMLNWTN